MLELDTGRIQDYTKRKGVDCSVIVLPDDAPDWAKHSEKLWNAVESKETRKNATVAREFEISLPCELNQEQRRALAQDLAQKLVDRFGFAVQYSIHKPSNAEDGRNHHVHILASTRKLEPEGFTTKTRELDDIKSTTVADVREMVADTINQHLKAAGCEQTVTHKSLVDQKEDAAGRGDVEAFKSVNREPTIHIGRHPVLSLQNRNRNNQIIFKNQHKAGELKQELRAISNPLQIRAEALALIQSQSISLFNKEPFKEADNGYAPAFARADSTSSASTSGGIEATISQIDGLEQQLSKIPTAALPSYQQMRANLKQQIEKLKGQLAEQLHQRDRQKTDAAMVSPAQVVVPVYKPRIPR